ncbi:hypothetical protein KAW80_01405 [Candidatus Babeliales bacterium]|nr:hypothetical protein [Candidatus Babeliales bacterium]
MIKKFLWAVLIMTSLASPIKCSAYDASIAGALQHIAHKMDRAERVGSLTIHPRYSNIIYVLVDSKIYCLQSDKIVAIIDLVSGKTYTPEEFYS